MISEKVLLSVSNDREGKINWMSINDDRTTGHGYGYGYGVDTVTTVKNGFEAVS